MPFIDYFMDEPGKTIGDKRMFAGYEFIHDYAEGKQIRLIGNCIFLHLFGRHITG